MITLIIVVHAIVCALLIIIILIQRGRGSGLVESFSGVESMFGTKTNAFFTRTTTVLAVLFMLSCVSLALLSARQSRSLMRNIKTEAAPKETPKVKEEASQKTQDSPIAGEEDPKEAEAAKAE